MHALLAPLLWFAHLGHWIHSNLLSPFSIGTTAKNIFEEEVGVYGVQAFIVYKLCRLLIDPFPLMQPRWLVGRLLRSIALCGAVLVLTYIVTSGYVGVLIDPLQLEVSYGGMLTGALVAWVALGYHYTRKAIDRWIEAAKDEELGEE